MKVSKARLEGSGSSLVWWKVFLPMAGMSRALMFLSTQTIPELDQRRPNTSWGRDKTVRNLYKISLLK